MCVHCLTIDKYYCVFLNVLIKALLFLKVMIFNIVRGIDRIGNTDLKHLL